MLPSDADARQAALDTTQSFAVSAPAGSGKTALLTQRVLALLSRCEQPENILAITFTRKAAAEMRQRILKALNQAQTEAPQEQYQKLTWALANEVNRRDQALNWQLKNLPHRLRITTIDGFCRQLSQQMPLSNLMGSTPEVMTAPELAQACRLAIRETLALLEQDHPLEADLSRLIRHFNNQLSNLETLFIRLLQRRDQWLGPLLTSHNQRQALEATLKQVILEHLSPLAETLQPFASDLAAKADFAACQLQHLNSQSPITEALGLKGLPNIALSALPQWRALAELCLTQKGEWRKTVDKRCGFPSDMSDNGHHGTGDKAQLKQVKADMKILLAEMSTVPELADTLQSLRDLPSPHYSDSQWQLLDCLSRVLSHLAAQLKVTFQQFGKTDYIDITQAAIQALGDEDQPTDLALALDYRIQHILVDEFQDTSSPQLRLIQQLTAGWQAGDGRTLFCVGDAMQSCYSFRDANVGIFLNCRQQGIGDLPLTPLDLRVNFRSHSALVTWFNRVFTTVLPQKDEINLGAVRYQSAQAFHQDHSDSAASAGTHSHVFVGEENNRDSAAEAEYIATLIKTAQQHSPDEKIAILVRKRQQVRPITDALKAAKIAYQATDIDRLNQQMIVQDLVSLTRALLYPNDRISWLSLLRAPWCGLSNADLLNVATFTPADQHHTVSLASTLLQYRQQLPLSQDGTQRLAQFCVQLDAIIAQQGRCPLHQWVESAWLQLGASSLLIAPDESAMVTAYFHCLKDHSHGWRIRHWDNFEHAIEQLFAKPLLSTEHAISEHATSEQGKQTESRHTVDIMTIHKSKGLEFDRVILPGLDILPNSDPSELLLWQEWLPQDRHHSKKSKKDRHSQLLISPVHSSGNERDPIYDFIRKQRSRKQQLESDRLLYVACTRAIRQLHLLGYIEKDSAPAAKSMLASLWPHIQDEAEYITLDQNAASEPLQKTLRHPSKILRRPLGQAQSKVPTQDLLKAYRPKPQTWTGEKNRAPSDSLQHRHQRYVGTVLHQALQQVTEGQGHKWHDQQWQSFRSLWSGNLRQLGLSTGQAQVAGQDITAIIQKMLKDKTGSWLLNHSHPQSACELSLWTSQDHQQREYIIDRTFIDAASNTRWIIDYKSSQPTDEQPLDDFMQQEAHQYRQQLLDYAVLFQHHPQAIRCALYFPRLLHLHEA